MSGSKPYSRLNLAPRKYLSHSITITSQTAVGKTTTIEELRKILVNPEWKFISAGAIMREFARKNKMTIEELTRYARENPLEQWDKRCDDIIRNEGRHNFRVHEGRRVHAHCPHSFHVLLLCPVEIRVQRRRRQKGYEHLSVEQIRQLIVKRDNDDERLDLIYPGSNWPREDFDLTLNTNRADPQEIAERIVTGHQEWYARGDKTIVNLHTIS